METKRLQKVVDKPVLDGLEMLPINAFLSLSSYREKRTTTASLPSDPSPLVSKDSSSPAVTFSSPSSSASSSSSSSSSSFLERKYVVLGRGLLRDVFLIEDVLSEEECLWLLNETEKSRQYTYWDVTGTAATSYRNAWTLEMNHSSLAAVIWDRVKGSVIPTFRIEKEDETRAERDLLGEWIAAGINANVLFARYTDGGHFSPHTDGCVAKDFNTRTFWPALLYLNAVEGGGETLIIDDMQKSAPMAIDDEGRHTAQPQWIVETVKPVPGRMLFFYYTQSGFGFCCCLLSSVTGITGSLLAQFKAVVLHESRSVKPGVVKYVIRTDVIYTRKLPLLTTPSDREAFSLWQKAQVLAEEGMTDEAAVLFRKSIKISQALAEVYGM